MKELELVYRMRGASIFVHLDKEENQISYWTFGRNITLAELILAVASIKMREPLYFEGIIGKRPYTTIHRTKYDRIICVVHEERFGIFGDRRYVAIRYPTDQLIVSCRGKVSPGTWGARELVWALRFLCEYLEEEMTKTYFRLSWAEEFFEILEEAESPYYFLTEPTWVR